MMKSTYSLALAIVTVFALAGGFAYAGNACAMAPQVSQPADTGAGPDTTPLTMASPSWSTDSYCSTAPAATCGAFCAAGQLAPGWPYDWCSEYWLRPNSNF